MAGKTQYNMNGYTFCTNLYMDERLYINCKWSVEYLNIT